ncbi:MAG TPA: sodium/proton-translocating pyrophosphatase [Armatimonadota bacterium]|nr:sodium/proton-translocating pyrophosphatase [Armatimonadota bacterium]
MSSQLRKNSSSRRSRTNQKLKTWFLGFLVLAMAGMIIAGPKLFAQGPSAAPAASAPAAAPAPAPAPTAEPAPAPTATPAPATAAETKSEGGEAVKLPFGSDAWIPLFIVLGSAFVALAFGLYWWSKTVAQDPGSERMQGVASAVQEGAMAYLARQVKTMVPLVIVIALALFFLYQKQYSSVVLGAGVAIAFALGVTASYLAGYVGMGVAVRGNLRVANAALSSFKRALETAFQAGAVSGMFTVGLGLLGATITFMVFKANAMFVLVGFGFGGSLAALFMRVGGGIFTKAADVGADLVGKVEAGIPEDDPRNAATIADNVGDNVGDCAGMAADVFESYEVTLVASIILAAAVGSVLQAAGFGGMLTPGTFTANFTLSLVIYALLVRAVGVFASIIGVLAVKGKDDPNLNPMKPINTGFATSAAIASLGFLLVAAYVFGPLGKNYDFASQKQYITPPAVLQSLSKLNVTEAQLSPVLNQMQTAVYGILKKDPKADLSREAVENVIISQGQMAFLNPANRDYMILLTSGLPLKDYNTIVDGMKTRFSMTEKIKNNFWWMAFLATFIGIILTQVIGKITEYFTADDKKPVTEIASSAKTGPATLILSGLSEGLESSVWGIVAIGATIYGAFVLFPNPAMAAYAIALAGLGLLATTGYVLAMDTYGPISDNANGIFEMSGALKNADGSENTEAHDIVARLDMVGNTTKALTKGFAIATAVIAAVALYRSFLDTVAVKDPTILVKNIQVNLPDVFVGLLIGGAIPFLFSSFAIRAVSRAAVQLVEEVRRQFRSIPGIWEYQGVGEKGKPDYARCVAISTAAAQKELLGPGLLAVFSPILVGFWLGAYALGGFLAGAILAGQLMAVFMSNTGGAWDNAKKKIEDGFLGGKGSEAHKAGVIGDTVGDPLKDTAGPALNPMIKVMNLVAILIAPSAVVMQGKVGGWIVFAVALVVLIIAIVFSKRGEVGSESSEESTAVSRQ